MPYRLALLCSVLFLSTALAQDTPKKHFNATTPDEAEQWRQESRKLLFDLLKLTDLATAKEMMPFEPIVVAEFDHSKYTLFRLQINSTKTRRIHVLVTIPKEK